MRSKWLLFAGIALFAGCKTDITKKAQKVVEPYVQNTIGSENTIKELTVLSMDTASAYTKVKYLNDDLQTALYKANAMLGIYQKIIDTKTAEYNKATSAKDKAAIKSELEQKNKEREDMVQNLKPIMEEAVGVAKALSVADKKQLLAYVAKTRVVYMHEALMKIDTLNVIVSRNFTKAMSVRDFVKQ